MRRPSLLFSLFILFWLTLSPREIFPLLQVNRILLGDRYKDQQVMDLKEMRYLSFWFKEGEEDRPSPLKFFIEIREDTDGDGEFNLGRDAADRVPAFQFITGKDPAGRKKVVVPFKAWQRITHWDRVVGIAFVSDRAGKDPKIVVPAENLLFGSNYPEGLKGPEISMQNRVSSFKIAHQWATPEMRLKERSLPLTLTLTFVDPYLEEIRFEESEDAGYTWAKVKSFFDHTNGGTYSVMWKPQWKTAPKPKKEILIRVTGIDLLGGETKLAGPYCLRFD